MLFGLFCGYINKCLLNTVKTMARNSLSTLFKLQAWSTCIFPDSFASPWCNRLMWRGPRVMINRNRQQGRSVIGFTPRMGRREVLGPRCRLRFKLLLVKVQRIVSNTSVVTKLCVITLLETNIYPPNWLSQKESDRPTDIWVGQAVSFQECNLPADCMGFGGPINCITSYIWSGGSL